MTEFFEESKKEGMECDPVVARLLESLRGDNEKSVRRAQRACREADIKKIESYMPGMTEEALKRARKTVEGLKAQLEEGGD